MIIKGRITKYGIYSRDQITQFCFEEDQGRNSLYFTLSNEIETCTDCLEWARERKLLCAEFTKPDLSDLKIELV